MGSVFPPTYPRRLGTSVHCPPSSPTVLSERANQKRSASGADRGGGRRSEEAMTEMAGSRAAALEQAARPEIAQHVPPDRAASRAGADRVSRTRLQTVLFLLAPMLTLIFVMYLIPHTDSDYWWHVRTGQYIWETGTLPRFDPFSYTAPDHPWVTHEWLTELIFYGVQSQFGYVGNVVLFGLLGVLTALTVWATCRRRGLGELGATVMMLWAVFMGVASIASVR